MLVSVIIPNWNGKSLLSECLSSINKQTITSYEVIVVDNGSTDGSANYLIRHFPSVKVVCLNKNVGFARAINAGVKASSAKYVVLLNNDTEVDKFWLENLVKAAGVHPEVISVNSKILNYYNRKIIDGVGILINEVGQARSIGWNEEDLGQYERPMYIFGATGGASLFKRNLFLKLGMFDENYFMYSEEVDFAFRAQFLGFKSLYCPKALVFHKQKATAKKLPSHIEYWQFLNMTQTIIKDFPAGVLFKNWRWLKIILVHINTIVYQFKEGFFWPPIMVELWLIWHLPLLLLKRAKIQKNIKVDLNYIEGFLTPKKIKIPGLK